MAIEVKNVSYTYMPGTPFVKQALTNVSFTLAEGERLAVIGRTGSGKSTLVQHLNGLISPTAGQVIIDGTDITAKIPRSAFPFFVGEKKYRQMRREIKAAKHKVGMVFQYPEQQLFEETVADDVAFGVKHRGIFGDEMTARIKEAMTYVGLPFADFAERSPFSLSGGQMRRAAIAGVLAMHPKYLVLDEPTAGLDPVNRDALMRSLDKFTRKHKTAVVIVTHSMDMVAEFADSVLVMCAGRAVLCGSPREVFAEREILRRANLTVPPITRLLARLKAGGMEIDDGAVKFNDGMEEILRAVKR